MNHALPARWIDLARDGDKAGDYARPTAAAMAFLCYAVNAGMSFADVEALTANGKLFDTAYLTKDDGRRRPLRSALLKMRRDYDKAARFVAGRSSVTSAAEAVTALVSLREAAMAARWPGRSGPRDRAVLLALVTVGESMTRPTVRPTISIRDLTEDTPFRGFRTVARAVESLEAAGWLTRSRDADPGLPTAYLLHVPPAGTTGESVAAEIASLRVTIADLEQRVTSDNPKVADKARVPLEWQRERLASLEAGGVEVAQHMLSPLGGTAVPLTPPLRLTVLLGMHGATIYAALGDAATSRHGVERATGFNGSTCRTWLRKLATLGLARQTPSGWVKGDTDPERVATEHNVDDVIGMRRTRHALQRQGWAEYRGGRATSAPQAAHRAPDDLSDLTVADVLAASHTERTATLNHTRE